MYPRHIRESSLHLVEQGLVLERGCRTNNWATCVVAGVKKRYPRWQFVNHSVEIRQWCTEALDLLEIPWRQSDWKTISVSTRAGSTSSSARSTDRGNLTGAGRGPADQTRR